jgi:hypothetical protein
MERNEAGERATGVGAGLLRTPYGWDWGLRTGT